LSSAQAAAFLLVMAVVSGVAAASGGFVLRLTGHRRKPVILFAVSMILLSTSLMLVAVWCRASGRVYLIAYVLLALSILGSPANLATMKEVNRPDAVAVAISVLNTAVYLGVGLAGNLAGAVLDLFAHNAAAGESRIVYPAEAYATLFACLAGLALVSTLVTALQIPETRGCPVTLEELTGS
jgi:predicted MFS family arabinose efflux permease